MQQIAAKKTQARAELQTSHGSDRTRAEQTAAEDRGDSQVAVRAPRPSICATDRESVSEPVAATPSIARQAQFHANFPV